MIHTSPDCALFPKNNTENAETSIDNKYRLTFSLTLYLLQLQHPAGRGQVSLVLLVEQQQLTDLGLGSCPSGTQGDTYVVPR